MGLLVLYRAQTRSKEEMCSIRWTCAGRQKDASEWIDIQPQRLSRIEEKNQFSLENQFYLEKSAKRRHFF